MPSPPARQRLEGWRGRVLALLAVKSTPTPLLGLGLPDDNFVGPPYQNSKVPEEWRKHAREPWRILFPDLEWSPPSRDE